MFWLSVSSSRTCWVSLGRWATWRGGDPKAAEGSHRHAAPAHKPTAKPARRSGASSRPAQHLAPVCLEPFADSSRGSPPGPPPTHLPPETLQCDWQAGVSNPLLGEFHTHTNAQRPSLSSPDSTVPTRRPVMSPELSPPSLPHRFILNTLAVIGRGPLSL